jgi:hypothetical protein
MQRTRLVRRLLVALAALLLMLLLVGGLALRQAVANPAQRAIWLDSPPIGGHIYSLAVLPCTPFSPGVIVMGRDLRIFSSYPPPGPKLPLAPPCP